MSQWLRAAALCIPATAMLNFGPSAAEETLEEKARRIHAEAYVLDTHTDTTPKFEDPDWDFTVRHEAGHVDIPRLREGGYDAVFWSIYMGKTPGDGRATKRAIRRIDSVHEMIRRHPDILTLATTAEDIREAAREGKIACLIGIEGGHMIEDELATLRTYHRLGARYMTLTHSFNTHWADSAGTQEVVEAEHDGLTDFGRDVVHEMNRLGMMVDVSHVADSTFWDVIETSKAPVIASHSSVRALANHRRNLTDDMIRAMASKGGVIQINFYPGYIDPRKIRAAQKLLPEIREINKQFADDPEKAGEARRKLFAASAPRAAVKTPASMVVDHIEYVIDLVGPDYVGLGADWDGVPEMPEGLEDVSKVPYITRELLRRGHDETTIKKVLGGNVLRLMEEVEQVARELGRML